MSRPTYSYGEPNWDLIGRWLHLAPEEDGPWWALNLMRYHEVAQYAEEVEAAPVSGKEADDAYAPLGPLAAVGAIVAIFGDVVAQPLGEPAWDRVGIVRYPTRRAFFEMQQRDDFQEQHVHKEAGMAFTINASLLPTDHDPAAGPASGSADDGSLVFAVWRTGDGNGTDGDGAGVTAADLGALDGVRPVAAFDFEGVVLGDDRTFDLAAFVRADGDAALDALVAALGAADEAHVVVMEPSRDDLVGSIVTAPVGGRGTMQASA